MTKRTWTTWTLGILGVAAVVAGGLTYQRFRRDLRAARSRLDVYDRHIVETAMGPIEMATWGEGTTPVLSIHGIMGGFDQGVMLAQGWLDPSQFRVIAPSRFGYLGTPMPAGDASPAAQADAFAALLDALDLDHVGVIATSAGGTSALQFALRHPDRCAGLVLVSSNAPSDDPFAMPPRPVMETVFGSDFLFWLLTTHFREQLYPMVGVPKSYTVTREDLDEINAVMGTLLPVSPRAAGAVHDAYVSNPDINNSYPFAANTVETLVIGAKDDPLAAYGALKTMADRLPNARLLTVAEGGHMLLGDDGRVPVAIQTFLLESFNTTTEAIIQ
jgi:pimeloyl-ACP methyl ester carboxylesterase